ncbi:Asp-tRNA(Asn)/Glu-tRNA(Gln) amidotransferase subunit GatA [Legionella hackeliae]|uniref:Glutamyl-tRNA(Gln) amidotransferase subunit A n=1 Tax=Legionella hackeliae TaxID=449 RepID=A0A0A8UTN7_LEGHA|nr:Asp-tRNA(Asn)/Glu-tRNA(Gln) amidotransferase subunit GatA [Legionella hackeliae]KTD13763.1 aspartyl/glutamyl-tRNA amidotransferase subunit A [Legionella hackeliae]CEK10462.1 Glutamyl-tRNA(Gln) amidotransferase subunit A [Legionella hackeliae]STX47198.1 aspartyl/glutamyl-tRNA amidotransferase subunit A [Legionella hackeliae]
MHHCSIKELAYGLRQGEFSSVELTQHFLHRIEQHSNLNAFIHVNENSALNFAAQADKLLREGHAKPLTGIPMAHKDLFCTLELPTTCGSKMLANYQSPYQATIVKRLAEEGVVVVGKTNMDEFAMGSANENSYFGPVQNPWDLSRVPGGSSGGSAAAIAASLIPFATGSDTGGSIRQPAAFCGISGIKPTYGLISRFGMVAFASSLDQAGPLAHSAEDLAIILQAMAGFDSRDSTSVNQPLPDYSQSLSKSIRGLKIGLPSCFFQKEVNVDIQQAIKTAVKVFQQEGAEIIELDLSLQPLWVPCYYVIACAEASSNLSRYDGIRFGHRSTKASTLHELIVNSRSEGFGEEVKRRILTGTHVLSSGYFDAYYLQALKIRRLIQLELQNTLNQVDIILGPTTPTCAFKIGEKVDDPIQNYLADVFTVAVNLAGLPALSIPAGFSEGLPIGMQLIGNYFEEAKLLNAAYYFQQCTDWHQARPTYKG